MKATEHYFSLVLFIFTFYKLVLSFESVYESSCVIIQMYEQCLPLVHKDYYAVQGGSVFWLCRLNLQLWPINWKLLSRTLSQRYLRGIPTFESVYKIPKRDHSNESWLVFSSVIGCNLFSEKKLTTALEYWLLPFAGMKGCTYLTSKPNCTFTSKITLPTISTPNNASVIVKSPFWSRSVYTPILTIKFWYTLNVCW